MCVRDQAALPVHPNVFPGRLTQHGILLLAGTFMYIDKLLEAGARPGPGIIPPTKMRVLLQTDGLLLLTCCIFVQIPYDTQLAGIMTISRAFKKGTRMCYDVRQ